MSQLLDTTPLKPTPHSVKYDKLEHLSGVDGAQGQIWTCKLRDDVRLVNEDDPLDSTRNFILKVIPIDQSKLNGKQLEYLLREKAILRRSASSPHVVKLYDVFQDDSATLSMVMERMDGDLFDLRKEGPAFVRHHCPSIIKQILAGTAAIHELGVVHRDIKPENILFRKLPSGLLEIKLADFGFAKPVAQDATPGPNQRKGTKLWMDRQTGAYYESSDILKQDIWAIGLIMHFLLDSGRIPQATRVTECIAHNKELTFSDAKFSAVEQEVLAGLLQTQRAARWSASQALEHPYFEAAPSPTVPTNAGGAPAPSTPAGEDHSTSWEDTVRLGSVGVPPPVFQEVEPPAPPAVEMDEDAV